MDLFPTTWAALRNAVAELPDEDFARPSGCAGWLVRDLACHLVIDAQDVLITLVTPAQGPPTADAVTYWKVSGTPPAGQDPLDALTVRLAAAYEDPALLKFHLDDVGSAAHRAAALAVPVRRKAKKRSRPPLESPDGHSFDSNSANLTIFPGNEGEGFGTYVIPCGGSVQWRRRGAAGFGARTDGAGRCRCHHLQQ